MTEDKQPLQYVTMTYIGKEATQKFPARDGKPEVTGYKYKFKRNQDDQFSNNFWGTSDTKGANILNELGVFTIGYVEKANPKGDKPMKMAKYFGLPKSEAKREEQQEIPLQEKPITQPVLMEATVAEKFAKAYRVNMASANKLSEMSENHFIGTWYRNNEPGKCVGLLAAYKTYVMFNEKPKEDKIVEEKV